MSCSFSSAPGKLSVVLSRRFSPFLFAFVPLWIALWVAFALKAYRNGEVQSRTGLLLFGFVTVLLIYSWLWNLGGREELCFTKSTLVCRHVLFGVPITRKFSMDRITGPRFVEFKSTGKSRIPSAIGFCYNGKEIRLADHLTQRDSKEIAARLVQQFPELAQSWGNFAEGLPELNEDLSLNLK